MSKTGQTFFEMQEDALYMTETEFALKWGAVNRDVWQELNAGDPQTEPDFINSSVEDPNP